PLVAQCLANSRRALDGKPGTVRFDRLTFTVQREVADRLTAGPGSKDYGPVSVLVACTGQSHVGPVLPPSAFWPPPKIDSRLLRIDFDPDRARRIRDVATLQTVLGLAFGQRRKQIGSVAKRRDAPIAATAFADALQQAEIDPTTRAEQVPPGQFLAAANALAGP
ncbi:MAG: ribosomal RNA small subunit methyltransferase A, partial [Planctomycetota bacterium]